MQSGNGPLSCGANKDHSLDGLILLDLRDSGSHAGGHRGTQRVHQRIIDGDDGNTVRLCELNQFAYDSFSIDFLQQDIRRKGCRFSWK